MERWSAEWIAQRKTGGFYKGNNKRLTVKSQIFVRSEVKTLWVCFIISHQVLISCAIDNSWNCVLKPRAVRPFVWGSVFSPPPTLSAIYQHVDKSFRSPLCLTWFPVDPCGRDHGHYLSILHCLLCHPRMRERRFRSSPFVTWGLVSAGVPPLLCSRNSFCVCYIVLLLAASSGEASGEAKNTEFTTLVLVESALASSICHPPIYLPLYPCL